MATDGYPHRSAHRRSAEDESSQERGGKSVSHQQRWAAKERRRSSDMKSFVSDKLELADNPKIIAILNRNGISLMCVYIVLFFCPCR